MTKSMAPQKYAPPPFKKRQKKWKKADFFAFFVADYEKMWV